MSMSMLKLLPIAAVSLASSLALAGEPAKVIVELSDGTNGHMSLKISPSSVPPGAVEFTVKNESGNTKHEFLFAKRSKPGDALPYDTKAQQVQEDGIKTLQGIEDLPPHETVTAQFTLDKGRYVVFCNEPGHYRSGMRTEFVVGAAK